MSGIDLGCGHTIKSHGASVARKHKHDWLILVLLAGIEVILNIIHPFYRFVGKDMMTDLKYPLKDNTVPVWAVPFIWKMPKSSFYLGFISYLAALLNDFVGGHKTDSTGDAQLYAVLLPIAVFLLFYIRRKDIYDLHHSILGLLFAVLITGVLTDAIKDAVGRPRPDFFWRCFPDGVDNYDRWGDVICHGKDSVIKEGHKSFPSGHASCKHHSFAMCLRFIIDWKRSFAGLGFLSLYLSGKIKAFDRRGHVAKLCIVFLPLLAASLVAVSRVDDYWHHWQDVFAGGLLGLVVATFCYLQFFPAPYHTKGWGPYAYFRAVEESHSNSRPVNAGEVEVANQQSGRSGNPFMPESPENARTSLVDVESGKI
ncbi:hypothetical protein RJ639_036362 [Escallonia herrerae]|uniref:Phosphatidic acid phosphatase type 2/haloperoxidase domain-containing protein n=1 Tax=Escallonia herrerae TaxID=1293975 RepID=A0AA88WPV0_9ASTE|nr:hypothetical protein RJ639_036362 [Escallonia herrerae]